jgi:hypothetical protein
MGNEVGKVAGNIGIPCKDFGNDCNCQQCCNARDTYGEIVDSFSKLAFSDFEETDKHDLLSYSRGSNWMGSLENVISNKKIYEISIPGTHHSGLLTVNSPVGDRFVLCQDNTIEDQLNGGIRHFDFRIALRDKKIVLSHKYLSDIQLEDCLNTVHSFLLKCKREIIIMDINRDYDHQLNDDDRDMVNSMLEERFKDMIISDVEMNIGSLLEIDRRLVITGDIYNNCIETKSSWADTKSPKSDDVCINVIRWCERYKAEEILKIASAHVTIDDVSGIFMSEGSLRCQAELTNRFLITLASKDSCINVLSHDYAHPDLIRKIIELNDD